MRFYEFYKPVFEDYFAITHANVTMWRHVKSIKIQKWRSWRKMIVPIKIRKRKSRRKKTTNRLKQIKWTNSLKEKKIRNSLHENTTESNWNLNFTWNDIKFICLRKKRNLNLYESSENSRLKATFYGEFYLNSGYSFCYIFFWNFVRPKWKRQKQYTYVHIYN